VTRAFRDGLRFVMHLGQLIAGFGLGMAFALLAISMRHGTWNAAAAVRCRADPGGAQPTRTTLG